MPAEDSPRRSGPQVVATASNGPEAEMISQILAGEGIPSLQQRSIDNPEFGAGGPRSILVKESDRERAREVLGREPSKEA